MKINGEFILREIADEVILVPVGQTALNMNGMIILNPVCGFIWKCLEQSMTREQILDAICREYDVDFQTARADLDELLEKLCQAGLLELNEA